MIKDKLSPNLQDSFLRSQENVTNKMSGMLSLLKSFMKLSDLAYTDMIPNRMRNIHALI